MGDVLVGQWDRLSRPDLASSDRCEVLQPCCLEVNALLKGHVEQTTSGVFTMKHFLRGRHFEALPEVQPSIILKER